MTQAPFLLRFAAAMSLSGAFGCGAAPSGTPPEPTASVPLAPTPALPTPAPQPAQQPALSQPATATEQAAPATPTAPPAAATMQGYPDLSGIRTAPEVRKFNETSAEHIDHAGLAAALGVSQAVAAVPVAPPPVTTAPVTPSGPRTYALDPAKSSIYVQVYKDPNTIGQGLSHDHVVAATGWSGSVVWDRARTEGCAVQVSVPVLGLVNDALALRKRVGYDTTLTDDQRAEVKEHMLAPGQLDAANFPKITFIAKTCSGTLGADGDGAVTVTGMFTLHGVAKAISPKLTVHADDQSFTARGSFMVNTTDFGFAPYTALLGALKNNNAMKFTVDVVGTRG